MPFMLWIRGFPLNDPAEGYAQVVVAQPEFRVGDGLSVYLSEVEPPDGVTYIPGHARYNWQRFDATGTTLERDEVASGPTYLLTADDEGKTLKVQVRFSNDPLYRDGPLTSAATPVIAASRHSTPSAMVSNLDQPETIFSSLTTGYEIAFPFTTGPNASGYDLTYIELRLSGGGSPAPAVSVVEDDSGAPADAVVATFAGAKNVTSFERGYVFTPTAPALVCSSRTYWVVVSGGDSMWRTTSSGAEDASSTAGWSLGDVVQARNAGSSSDFNERNQRMMMRVNAAENPSLRPTLPEHGPAGGRQHPRWRLRRRNRLGLRGRDLHGHHHGHHRRRRHDGRRLHLPVEARRVRRRATRTPSTSPAPPGSPTPSPPTMRARRSGSSSPSPTTAAPWSPSPATSTSSRRP